MGVRKKFPSYQEGAIYRNWREPAGTRYGYLMPADYAEGCYIGDCLLCDEHGNPKPGYEYPVPVHASNLGPLVRVGDYG